MVKRNIVLMIRSLFIHICLYQHLKSWSIVGQTTDTAQESSAFICKNGKTIDFMEKCNGIWNCDDGSDEECDDEGILFYYSSIEYNQVSPDCLDAYNNEGLNFTYFNRDNSLFAGDEYCYSKISTQSSRNIIGVFLNENKEFSVDGYEFSSSPPRTYMVENETRISPYGSFIYTFFPSTGAVMRQERNAHSYPTYLSSSHGEGTNEVFDWLTSKIYWIMDSKIEVCDELFNKCVKFQSDEFVKHPILLAISVKYRLLFWIHEDYTSEYFLYVDTLRKDGNSKSTLVLRDVITPKWLTIDPITDRIYCLSNDDGVLQFYSFTFEGTDVEVLSPGVPIPDTGSARPSFAVFNGSIYWPDGNTRNIMKCSTNDCSTPTIFKKVPVKPHPPDTSFVGSSMGSLTIDYRALTPRKIKEPCDRMCSHLCLPNLPTSENGYTCYCDGLNKSFPINSINGYCKDETLIAAYQNSLYVIGLPKSSIDNPSIHKNTINISSISALAYNSIDGSVVLTETGKQRIHSWIPRTGELKLISDDGHDGTIDSIEFDNHANNLYWIDHEVHSIKVMNMKSQIKAIILEGNSSYSPIQFTLVPARGYMAILFLKESSIAIIELISMEGGSYSRKTIFEYDKNNKPKKEDFVLHYLSEIQWICLLDKQTNWMKYFSEKNTKSRDLPITYDLESNIETITSLKSKILLMSLNDLTIQWTRVDGDHSFSYINIVRNISLGIKKTNSSLEATERSFVKMTNVMQQITEPRLSKCLHNNGGCQKLCLSSNRPQRFVCSCPESEQLINDTLCMTQLELESSIMTESDEADYDEPDDDESNKNLMKFNDHEMKSTTKSGAEEKRILFQETEPVITVTQSACVKSCPICPKRMIENALSLNSSPRIISPSSTNSTHIFYSVTVATVALCLGVVVGYLIRGKWFERRKLKLLNHQNVQLTRMRTESVCTTRTALDQDQ